MAKKKIKNFKVEQDELKPITVGAFESRRKSSIGTFFILTVFVLVIVFLPQITDIVNEYLNPTVENSNPVNPSDPNEPIDPNGGEDNPNSEVYSFSTGLSITRDDITVNSFVLNTADSTISYNVINNLENAQNIEDLNYYIEIYNSERTLMERVKLSSSYNLVGGAFQTFTKPLKSQTIATISYIMLVKRTINEYPEVELDEETQSLVCTRGNEEVTYRFSNNLLKDITSIINYRSSDPNYESVLDNYRTLANDYNAMAGINSTFFSYDAGFNITTLVDLTEADTEYVFNADTFRLDEQAKVVSFEMEAQGFECD